MAEILLRTDRGVGTTHLLAVHVGSQRDVSSERESERGGGGRELESEYTGVMGNGNLFNERIGGVFFGEGALIAILRRGGEHDLGDPDHEHGETYCCDHAWILGGVLHDLIVDRRHVETDRRVRLNRRRVGRV